MTNYSFVISMRSKIVFQTTIMPVGGALALTETKLAMRRGMATLTGTVDTRRERAAVTESAFEGVAGNKQLTVS